MYSTKEFQTRIARRCRRARTLSGLTQNDVANATGYTQPQVSRFERGQMASFYLLIYYIVAFKLSFTEVYKDGTNES